MIQNRLLPIFLASAVITYKAGVLGATDEKTLDVVIYFKGPTTDRVTVVGISDSTQPSVLASDGGIQEPAYIHSSTARVTYTCAGALRSNPKQQSFTFQVSGNYYLYCNPQAELEIAIAPPH